MPRYVCFWRFTEKGTRAIKQSTSRAHAFHRAAAQMGVQVEAQYWTMGRWDGVMVLSAEKEEQAMHAVGLLTAAGFVRTETLPAFTDQEFERMLGQ
jgi:uncharacterized protein with GYD domain